MSKIILRQGDCLQVMKEIPDGSVDMILTDPPYGTAGGMGASEPRYKRLAESEWDECLPQKEINEECNRVLRTNGAMAVFSQEPFTSRIICEAHNNVPFSYRLVWIKDHFANSLGVNKAPVNYTEDVCLFFKKHTKHDFDGFHPLRPYAKMVMNFIGKNIKQINVDLCHRRAEHFFYVDTTQFGLCTEVTYNELINKYSINEMEGFREFSSLIPENKEYRDDLIKRMTAANPKVFNLPEGAKYKSNVLEYKKDYTGLHPTQKPVALLEDLIRTYTNEGDMVLDFTAGSFTTGVACVNLNRKFIGIELGKIYFDIGVNRITERIKCLDLKIEPVIDMGG